MTSSGVAAHPASTVIVLRDSSRVPSDETPQRASVEVLMVKRNDTVAFMAGAYVFPGGKVDEADSAGTEASSGDLSGRSRFSDLSIQEEQTYQRAAVRELAEEAGVRIPVGALMAFAHWVTPKIEMRRYDTRFFLARMPDGQQARHDDSETTALAWLTPKDAIAQCRAGEIVLPPPTWTSLRQLERFASADEVYAWARTRSIVRVEPGFVKNESVTMLTLPGDPLFPTIPGWEVPEETRFVLEDGKGWLPKVTRLLPGFAVPLSRNPLPAAHRESRCSR